jgi:hypothetical protein
MVGNDERQERAADDDGSDEEGEGGQGNGDGNQKYQKLLQPKKKNRDTEKRVLGCILNTLASRS